VVKSTQGGKTGCSGEGENKKQVGPIERTRDGKGRELREEILPKYEGVQRLRLCQKSGVWDTNKIRWAKGRTPKGHGEVTVSERLKPGKEGGKKNGKKSKKNKM